MEENKSGAPTEMELKKQIMYLVEQLQKADMYNTHKRLDYCFKVVENATAFDPDFVEYCKRDIVNIMDVRSNNEE